MTTPEEIVCRQIWKAETQFQNMGKVLFSVNDLNLHQKLSSGFYRRLRIIPLLNSFKSNPNLNLLPELKEELPQIMNLVLDAYFDYLDEGLEITTAMEDIQIKLLAKNNSMDTFIHYYVQFDSTSKISSKKLYNYYTKWCGKMNVSVEAKCTFGIAMTKAFPNTRRKNSNNYYLGISISESYHLESTNQVS